MVFVEVVDDDSEGKYVGKMVKEIIIIENFLVFYDVVEVYMIDVEIVGLFIMFVFIDYYLVLKNVKGVLKIFIMNE